MRHNHRTGMDTAMCGACVGHQFEYHDAVMAIGEGVKPTPAQYTMEMLMARLNALENRVHDLEAKLPPEDYDE